MVKNQLLNYSQSRDITKKSSKNLLSLSFDDKAKDESDELSITLKWTLSKNEIW